MIRYSILFLLTSRLALAGAPAAPMQVSELSTARFDCIAAVKAVSRETNCKHYSHSADVANALFTMAITLGAYATDVGESHTSCSPKETLEITVQHYFDGSALLHDTATLRVALDGGDFDEQGAHWFNSYPQRHARERLDTNEHELVAELLKKHPSCSGKPLTPKRDVTLPLSEPDAGVAAADGSSAKLVPAQAETKSPEVAGPPPIQPIQ